MEKVAIAGHSLVHWFGEYVDNHPVRDSNFGLDQKVVKYFGVRGLTVRGVEKRLLPKVRSFDPDWIILMLGDNDLSNPHMDTTGLAYLIIHSACELRRDPSVTAVISLLLPRYEGTDPHPDHPFDPTYDKRAAEVNAAIRKELASGRWVNISCWQHDFGVFQQDNKDRYKQLKYCFRKEDGVHLSDDGQVRLYRSFKLLLRGLRRQQSKLALRYEKK